jgi:hypothetical protein
MTTLLTPQPPSSEVVNRFLDDWRNVNNYVLQERSLKLLFGKFCPENVQIEHVLLKVSTLNDFYSTNIFNKYAVASHIVTLDVDRRLVQGDETLVNEIAKVPIGTKVKNFYSFATKYCSHHRPTEYPIYDQYVEKMLMHFAKKDRFHSFQKLELKSYKRFVEVILAFRKHYELSDFSLREIDIYLWLGGKEAFPPKFSTGKPSPGN